MDVHLLVGHEPTRERGPPFPASVRVRDDVHVPRHVEALFPHGSEAMKASLRRDARRMTRHSHPDESHMTTRAAPVRTSCAACPPVQCRTAGGHLAFTGWGDHAGVTNAPTLSVVLPVRDAEPFVAT